jgi:MHS family proline/betaine transporter-like MFS transporter
MFSASDRLSGYSVSCNLGLGVVGGATPMIVTGLIEWSGSVAAAGVFPTVAGAIVIVAAWTIRDRSGETLR